MTAKVRRDLSWSTVGTIGTRVAGAAGGVLSARLLGPADKGLAAVGILVGATIGSAATLGLQFWIIPAIAGGRSGRAVHHVIATMLRRILVGLGVAISVAVAAALVLAPGRAGLVAAVGLLASTWTVSMLVLAVLNGRMEMRRIAVVSALGGALNLVAMAVLLAAGWRSVVAVVVTAAAANGIMVPLGWRSLRSLRTDGRPPGDREVSHAVRFGLPNGASELVTMAAARADLVIVSALLTARDAGWYAVAIALGEGLLVVPDAVAQVLIAHGAGGTSRRMAGRIVVAATVITALGGVVLVALGGWAVRLVFGADFHGAVRALPWLAASATLAGAWKMGAADAVARGLAQVRLHTAAGGLVALVATALVLVPRFGIAGAGAASATGWAVATALLVARVRSAGGPDAQPVPGPVPVEVG